MRIFFQAKLFLKCGLILHFFLAECLNRIIFHNVRVCLRIELIVVNSIYNSGETIGTGIHKSVQLFSVKWCLYFFCVGIAYRCHAV